MKGILTIVGIVIIVGGLWYYFGKTESGPMVDDKKELTENTEITMSFLEENKTKEGVVTTPSGLQYKITNKAEGDGVKPELTSQVEVHYHGTKTDGEVFDSSKQRGQTITFPLNGVIAGWQEGLQLMEVGDVFELYIPAELAYGPAGSGHPLGGETLIFEVELFNIK